MAPCARGEAPAAVLTATETGSREAALEFVVNGVSRERVLFVLQEGERLWLEGRDFASLGLIEPAAPARTIDGRRYLPLDAVPGVAIALDAALQRVELRAPPEAFTPSRFAAGSAPAPPAATVAPGAFLNYELYHQQTDTAFSGALAELGLFAAPGVLTHSALATREPRASGVVRLDTTFTRDFPERLLTLSLGDVISDPGSYGNAVRLGGLRFARDFELRPDLVTMPLLSSAGSATVPSTVDVLVNGQRVSSQAVGPGPFVIDRLPTVSGAGEVSLVVRDALGREQVTTRDFYASTQLLAAGLSEYALDVGALREDYTLASNRYGDLAAQGTYRRGLTDAITLELHGESGATGLHNAGASVALALGRAGILSATLAGGGDDAAGDALHGLAFERRGRRLTLLAADWRAAAGYRQLGDAVVPAARVTARTLLQAGVALGRGGAFALAWARQRYVGLEESEVATASWSVSLGELGALSATLSRTLAGDGSTAGFLVYTRPLDARRTVSLSGAAGSAPQDEAQIVGSFAQSGGPGPGVDYRIGAGSDGTYDARWQRRFDAMELELQASRDGSSDLLGVRLDGAVTLLGGELRPSRSVGAGFALVETAGLEGVPIRVENQVVARSDAAGRVLLTDLRAYETNRIAIDPADLPLDVSIEAPELLVVPRRRSGVVATLGVRRIRPGTFMLLREDRTPVPAGAWVDFNGERFQVALDGFVYVTNFDHGLAATASWTDGRCQFRIEPPPAHDPQPDMGVLICRRIGGPSIQVRNDRRDVRGGP
jgi:outer membrane usher protein